MLLVIYMCIKSDGLPLLINPDEMSDEKPVVHKDPILFFSAAYALCMLSGSGPRSDSIFYVKKNKIK